MQPRLGRERVLDLLLHRDNPRHSHQDGQSAVIDYLLQDEEVYNLARHMSSHGINPLEVIAVFGDANGSLVVAEGNRRVCAAQLLTDPEKAPTSVRGRFRALASKSRDVSEINVARFDDYETARPWLQVLHDGEQDGVGRRRWKPDQKARATLAKSNDALAVALLDKGFDQNLIDAKSRKDIRVSTATRYLANPVVRRAMGITSQATSSTVDIDIEPALFVRVLERFFNGIRTKELHSRSVTKDWLAFATALESEFDTPSSRDRYAKSTQSSSTTPPVVKSRPKRVQITVPQVHTVIYSAAIATALNELSSTKLSSLYLSITGLKLDEHPALLTAGAWVFIESLTALHGRKNTDFASYVNSRVNAWGVDKDKRRDIGLSLTYVSSHGNAEKHSGTMTALDARNLSIHFQVLEDTLVQLIMECSGEHRK